ncbi:MAG TPA: Na/Pi cotransporter family protein [Deltaproteobacteria bacterium]|nr:Na/Pi cotransporter family protein [Deltaproteobacteria bacterium]
MELQTFLGIVGGLGLFVYGMYLFSDALQKGSHGLLKSMLEPLTVEQVKSVLVGTGAAAVIQSSSAAAVTVSGFLNAGIIQLPAALAVMTGANIGTTVTAHFLASRLTGVAPLFVFAGALYYFFVPKARHKNQGLAVFGFGIIFIGLAMMSSAVHDLAAIASVDNFFLALAGLPPVAILAGVVLAVILRNSSSAMGVVIAFALGGLCDLTLSLYLVFGINLGGALTILISETGTYPAGVRLALGNLFLNTAGLAAAVFMAPLYLEQLPLLSGSLPRQIAFAHTFFNLVVLAFFLLLAPIVVKALERIVPGESDRKQEVRYLNESLISTPYLALIAVIKELTVMLSICRGMLDKAEACIVAYNHKIKNELIFDEESVDEMQKNITAYLVEITRNDLTDRQRRLIPALLHSVNDLEKVGDYCENIVILAQRLSEENLAFSGTAREELERLFAKTRTMMKHTLHAVESNDREAAQITLTIRKEIDELIDRYKLSHVTRLETGACTSEPGLVFSDVLTDLDRINGHLLNITKGVLHMGKR